MAIIETNVKYCYIRQVWIVDYRVDKCGHGEKFAGCYGCEHAGEHVICNCGR